MVLFLSLWQPTEAIQFLTNVTAPSGLSAGCVDALTADISCTTLVPRFRYGFFYGESILNSSCTSTCESALDAYETSVVAACSEDTWEGYDDEGGAPLGLIPSLLLYQYSLTCLRDNGRWCNSVTGDAAMAADPGGKKKPCPCECSNSLGTLLLTFQSCGLQTVRYDIQTLLEMAQK